jgi:hypothetical protein
MCGSGQPCAYATILAITLRLRSFWPPITLTLFVPCSTFHPYLLFQDGTVLPVVLNQSSLILPTHYPHTFCSLLKHPICTYPSGWHCPPSRPKPVFAHFAHPSPSHFSVPAQRPICTYYFRMALSSLSACAGALSMAKLLPGEGLDWVEGGKVAALAALFGNLVAVCMCVCVYVCVRVCVCVCVCVCPCT